MTDYHEMKRGISREWAAARVVLIGGFIVAIAVAGYFVWQQHQQTVAQQQQQAEAMAQAAKQQQQQQTMTAAQEKANAHANAGMLLCAMELLSAKNMGIVPQFGQLTSMAPKELAQKGRYACTAATPSLKYSIEADLVCRNLGDAACVKIHAIKLDDGTTLYTAPAK